MEGLLSHKLDGLHAGALGIAAAHEQGVGPSKGPVQKAQRVQRSKGPKGPLDIINLMTELAPPAPNEAPLKEGDAAPLSDTFQITKRGRHSNPR
jgi:hypothetical protein